MSELDLRRFGEVLAYVQFFGPAHQPEVLERLGTDDQAYIRAATTHPARAGAAAAKGDTSALDELGRAFQRTKARLDDERPTLESIGGRAVVPDVDETLSPVTANVRRAALPFSEPAKGGEPPQAPAATPAYEDASGETLVLAPSPGATPATPFEQRALEGWTLEKYASFIADRRALGIEAIRESYGVPSDLFEQHVVDHFNELFTKDGSLRSQWMLLIVERARHHQGGGR